MIQEIIIPDLGSIDSAAKLFLEKTAGRDLIAFYAPMGAGKTTFTTAICKALGVESDAISSPTFAIVNEYRTAAGEPLFHFDFYRITKDSEALDIGLYDYLDSGCKCFMEWPENIQNLLPEETLSVHIEPRDDQSRRVWWED